MLNWYEAQVLHETRVTIETFVDAIAIGAIVIINAIVGFVQEYRSEKAMEALEKLTTSKARVLREGKYMQIPAREVVPEDIILLEAGDRMPADARLLEVVDLSMDPPIDDVMQRPPRSPKEGILHGTLVFIVASSLVQLTVEILAFWWGFSVQGSLDKARTMVFIVACFFELVVIWNCRSENRHAFRVGFFNNKALLVAVAISVLSTFAVIYVPALQFLFQTVMLDLTDWAVVTILSLAGFLLVPEILYRKKNIVK